MLVNDIKISNSSQAQDEIKVRKEMYPGMVHQVHLCKNDMIISSIPIAEMRKK